MKLHFEQLTKVYNGKVIFKGISAVALTGEPLVVAGPNGSGKSTLLKILCGLLRPTGGSVRLVIEGAELSPAERRNRIGYVSPEINLYERLTAFENLAFFAAVRGLAAVRPRLRELLELVQLKEAADQPVGQFSSGMKQRIKLACALLHDPCVLMLDEPTSNLDEQGKRLLAEIVESRQAKNIVIIATNEPEEVEKFGRKVLRLGLASGSPG